MHERGNSGPTVTVTYVVDLKVDVGTDLAKLERDIQDLLSGAPVEVQEVEIDNLGITEQAFKAEPIYKQMEYRVEPLTTGATWVDEATTITPQQWNMLNARIMDTMAITEEAAILRGRR